MPIDWYNPDPFSPDQFAATANPEAAMLALEDPEALALMLAKAGVRPGRLLAPPATGLLGEPGALSAGAVMPTGMPTPPMNAAPGVPPMGAPGVNAQSSLRATPALRGQSPFGAAMQGIKAVQPPAAQFLPAPSPGRVESPPVYRPNPQTLALLLQMLQQQQQPSLAQLMPR